jgi:hypothetical protein
MAEWSQHHPWWFALVSALFVTTPALAVAVWKDWPLGDLAPTLLFNFLLWFVGGALKLRRSRSKSAR